MRILQVLAGAAHGGAETAFVDTCLAMKEAGQEVEVVTRSNPVRVPALKNAGISVHILPFGGALDLYTSFAIRRICQQFKPAIVQTWMSRGASKSPKWSGSMGIPPYLVVSRLGGYYKLKYFKTADYFTTITPDIRRYLIDHGVAPDHVLHINNFAETETDFVPVQRSDYGVPEGVPLMLALGRLHESKALDVLIRAVHAVPEAYLWIAGEGPAREALEALIEELGVGARVRLLGWRSDRAALFAASDICVFPSRYEPFGTVFVQAWAHKRPLICSDADGPRQFVKDGVDGLVVPRDDVDALAGAIQRLIDDAGLCARLVGAGYARYAEEFTKEKTVQAYLDYFREIRAREFGDGCLADL